MGEVRLNLYLGQGQKGGGGKVIALLSYTSQLLGRALGRSSASSGVWDKRLLHISGWFQVAGRDLVLATGFQTAAPDSPIRPFLPSFLSPLIFHGERGGGRKDETRCYLKYCQIPPCPLTCLEASNLRGIFKICFNCSIQPPCDQSSTSDAFLCSKMELKPC